MLEPARPGQRRGFGLPARVEDIDIIAARAPAALVGAEDWARSRNPLAAAKSRHRVVYKGGLFATLRLPFTFRTTRPSKEKKPGLFGKKVIEIAEHTSYRMRTSRTFHAGAFVGSPESSRRSATLQALSPTTSVRLDVGRGSVSVLPTRRSVAHHGLAAIDRDAHLTLTEALALRARMAESAADLRDAHELVRRRYAWRGYDVDDPASAADEADFEEAAAERIVFVAKNEDATIGTMTLGLDGEGGLLAEASYGEVIEAKRRAGARVCEVNCLAVAEEADSKPVLAALFSVAFAAASARGVTDVFVEVNPRHVVFYRRVLGFKVAAGEKICERVKAPSVLLWLKMDDLERHLQQLASRVAASAYAGARAA